MISLIWYRTCDSGIFRSTSLTYAAETNAGDHDSKPCGNIVLNVSNSENKVLKNLFPAKTTMKFRPSYYFVHVLNHALKPTKFFVYVR